MSNQCQFIRQTAALLLACGLIVSLLPGFAAADKVDNQWGPGYRITDNGLRIDGIRADNPTNRVIYDNDFYFDAMDFAYLAAQDKLGRVDFRGFIVTRNSHQKDGYVRMVRQYNHYRELAIQSGLWVPEHIGGVKEPLVMPESGKIDDTKYELSDGARLIIEQADASTPENPLIVFCGGQFTTVATALLERPDIANNLIVFGAGQVENTYNSDDGWSAYVTAMRAPVVNMREGFAKVDGGYDKSKKQYDPLPKNPLIRDFYNTKVIREQDAGIVDGGTVVWLFNQHLVTGAQRRDLTVPGVFNTRGRLLDSFINVNRTPYGHLHLPDSACNFEGMIEAMVDVLKDPRVWDPDYSAKPVPNQPTNPIASAQAIDQTTQTARIASAGAIVPVDGPVLAGKPVTFKLSGNPSNPHWDLGDGVTADGSSVSHTYQKPGVYRVVMGSKVGDTFNELSSAIVRVHTPETLHLPQVLLDTDARNEVDDQHYIAYALFSGLDVLGINSIHHGGGQEPVNYGEIKHILELAKRSGLPDARLPRVFRGADHRLEIPEGGEWSDTEPIVTDASEAILSAARGASPGNQVWVLPVGPCSNVASAILQARREGLELRNRIRVCWLGGGPTHAHKGTFNGKNDPWSVYVTAQSGIECLILLENPTGASLKMDKTVESALYPNSPLGDYLEAITPARPKALYDVATVAMVIGHHLGKDWIAPLEPSTVLGPDQDYRWKKADEPTSVHIIRTINHAAMKKDFFDTLNGHAAKLRGSGK